MSEKKKSTSKKVTYKISGMHCAACETLVRKEAESIEHVSHAAASLRTNTVEILAAGGDEAEIKKALKEKLSVLGYSIEGESPADKNKTISAYLTAFGLTLIVAAGLWFLEFRTGISTFTLTAASSPVSFFIFGILASITGCAALVGSIVLTLSKRWSEMHAHTGIRRAIPFGLFAIGRVVSFTVLGFLLGMIGSTFQLSVEWYMAFSFVVALIMLLVGLQMLQVPYVSRFQLRLPSKLSAKSGALSESGEGKWVPAVVGALTVFVPCGLTLIAQTTALSIGIAPVSALMLGVFALGTIPVLGLIAFGSISLYRNPHYAKIFSLFVGFLLLYMAFHTLFGHARIFLPQSPVRSDAGDSSKNTASLKAATPYPAVAGDAEQVLRMTAGAFEYGPDESVIQVGKKTRWEIQNNGARGCAAALYAKGLYPEVIYLQPGLNVIEFTPQKVGTYRVSCAMNMVPPIIVKVVS